jgi:hypothetical protein
MSVFLVWSNAIEESMARSGRRHGCRCFRLNPREATPARRESSAASLAVFL